MKKISVVMATYNGEKFILNQLNSILCQLGKDDEVIISDDLSTDNTINIIHSIQDDRIKIFYHQNNHGYTENFENALKHATGDYIFLSDQDDEWSKDKVAKTIEKLDEYDLVVSDCITVNESGKVLDDSRFRYFHVKKGYLRILIRNRYLGCCMAFNKKILQVILPFPKRTDLVEHDTWIASVSEKYFNVCLIDEPLVYYKRHGNNVSDGGFNKGYSLFNKIYRRLYRIKELQKLKKRI